MTGNTKAGEESGGGRAGLFRRARERGGVLNSTSGFEGENLERESQLLGQYSDKGTSGGRNRAAGKIKNEELE